MSTDAPAQDFSNHRKSVPAFHYVALPILLINFIYSTYVAVTSFSVDSAIAVFVAVALIIIGLFARIFALGAQDRVIRLEERLRLKDLLPAEQQADVAKLTTKQMVGLRFASDGELAELVAAVCAEGIESNEDIKKRIKNWRPDHQRL